MIPKIIHYCWISGDPFPEKIQHCYDSWKKALPDYQIVVWDYKKAHAIGSRWVNQAIAAKKYAFAADYIRFYALYNYGGIYLDSDVEVLKPFDDLLDLHYFIGKEKDSPGGIEAAVIGAEKGIPWIKSCLDYYKNRRFIGLSGELNTTPLPIVMRHEIEHSYKLVNCDDKEMWKWSEDTVCIFPTDWFSPKSWKTLQVLPTPNTYSIHHFSGSWLSSTTDYKLSPINKLFRTIRPWWYRLSDIFKKK